MDNKQFDIINKKLDTLIKVTGMAACRGLSRDEQSWLLYCAGLSSREIGDLLGSDSNAVDQAIHRMKSKSKTTNVRREGKQRASG